MADIPEEHLTEELLDRLLASASIEQYLDEGLVSARTLTDYLFDRMEAHGLKPSRRGAGIRPQRHSGL